MRRRALLDLPAALMGLFGLLATGAPAQAGLRRHRAADDGTIPNTYLGSFRSWAVVGGQLVHK